MNYFQHVFTHLRKDLLIEWRSRDAINGMLFFALLIVVVFSLAFDPTSAMSRQIIGGILCVALLFAATTALNLSWNRELRNDVLDAQRLAPAPASALFLGKALANLIFVAIVEAFMMLAFVLFYNMHVLGNAWQLLIVLPLGTWAIIINGTFFAALSLRTRNRELLLPLILIPIELPALMGMIQATSNILNNGDAVDIALWMKMLTGYDIAFTTVSILLFEFILHAE